MRLFLIILVLFAALATGGCLRPLELGLGASDLADSGTDTGTNDTDSDTDNPSDAGDDDTGVPDGSPT